MTTTAEPKVGDILEGRVINIFEKYALVSLREYYVGRLSNKQITWFREKNAAATKLIVGTHIKVIVRQIGHSKKVGNVLIQLGYRELMSNPWDLVESRFPIGAHVEGKIVEILEFGAILQLDFGYTGILHNSELSWTDKNAKISQNYSIDENISVLVKNSDSIHHSLVLSHRETHPDPIGELFVGAKTTGKIINISQYGAFIELKNKCIALLHHTKLSANFDGCLDDVLDIEIEKIDLSTRRISVSLLKT